MLLVRVSAPAPNALGSTNGVVHFSINFARAISPAIIGYDLPMHFFIRIIAETACSSLFAVSTQYNLVGGSLWAWVMVIMGFLGLYSAGSLDI